MGNQGSQLGDEPSNTHVAARQLQHFDHSFKASIHTIKGPLLAPTFGECSFEDRQISITCSATTMEVTEDQGLRSKSVQKLVYTLLTAITLDHSTSSIKLVFSQEGEDDTTAIFALQNSVEFEAELRLRLHGVAHTDRAFRPPQFMYVGMFAGATKPKPFQRKRPNVTTLTSGKLPNLNTMRTTALDLHRGSYRPCKNGESRRMDLAILHIHEGFNYFRLIAARGMSELSYQLRQESILQISDDRMSFKGSGFSGSSTDFPFEDIEKWTPVDNDNLRANDSGIEVELKNGETVFFGVLFVRDLKHTLEYFWNKYRTENGLSVMLGSTHGRPITSVHTLSGEMPAPEAPIGQTEIVDQDGIVVRPGGKMAQRRKSLISIGGSEEPQIVPPENRHVKAHWHKVVKHQGWLLKKGGVGIGTVKNWIKRYFVLYGTSQGHFLVYYSDFTECPMYTSERNYRNVVDIAKCCFVRPGSNKADDSDTPPNSFDIVTTEREWTLCAETQENMHKWLKLLTRAIDEDVAILPDEEIIFQVKPKVDPIGCLPKSDYSTALKVSSFGASVTVPEKEREREHFFWVYTDFYKWSLLTQNDKLALLVNVFADPSFSRRNEFVFRNKEAQRLATAIEYFIEKFMCVMHVTLELSDTPEEDDSNAQNDRQSAGLAKDQFSPSGMKQAASDEWGDGDNDGGFGGGGGSPMQMREVNLLDMDDDTPAPSYLPPPPVPSAPPKSSLFEDSDPFGGSSDPFSNRPAPSPALSIVAPKPGLGLGLGQGRAPPVPPSMPSPLISLSAGPVLANAAPTLDIFEDSGDPFASSNSDVFAGSSMASALPTVAPPLSAAQIAQHNRFFQSVASTGSGGIYDDGVLQIAIRIEVKGSQARVTLFYKNVSASAVSGFEVSLKDSVNLLRSQLAPAPVSVAPQAMEQQVVMVECMKPGFPGPSLSLSYKDPVGGDRTVAFDLPLLVSSFNEPLPLPSTDFDSRWGMLSGAGQEVVDVITFPGAVTLEQVSAVISNALKMALVQDRLIPTANTIEGAALLRTGAPNPASPGDKITVGILLKAVLNPSINAVQVSVRTLFPAVSSAMVQTIKRIIS